MGERNKHFSFVMNEGVSQMDMGQDKNIDEGLNCPLIFQKQIRPQKPQQYSLTHNLALSEQ